MRADPPSSGHEIGGDQLEVPTAFAGHHERRQLGGNCRQRLRHIPPEAHIRPLSPSRRGRAAGR